MRPALAFPLVATLTFLLAGCGELDESDFADPTEGEEGAFTEAEGEARINYRYDCTQYRSLYFGSGMQEFEIQVTARKLAITDTLNGEGANVQKWDGKLVSGYEGTGSRAGKNKYTVTTYVDGAKQQYPGSIEFYADKAFLTGGKRMRNGKKGGFFQIEVRVDTYGKGEYVCYRQ